MPQDKKPTRSMGMDPYTSFRFRAELDGLEVSGFSEVTGLAVETDVESFREGGLNTHERQLPGPAKFPGKLTLKRGLADADHLWTWYQEIMKGKIIRRNLKIKLLDQAGQERWQWMFDRACPVKWSGPDFRAGTAEVAFEAIELVHEGLKPGTDSGLQQKRSK